MKDFSERFKVGDKVEVEQYLEDGPYEILGFDMLNECYIAKPDPEGAAAQYYGFYGPGIYRLDEDMGVSLLSPESGPVTITLTGDEAYALATVCSRIGGDPADTPRGHMDTIRVKLEGEGFYFGDSPFLHRFDRYIQAKGV